MKYFHRLFVDDGLVLAAWLMTIPIAIIWQIEAEDLYFAVFQRLDALPSDYLARIGPYLHGVFATHLFLYSSLWSIKLSLLFFFRRLGRGISRQKVIWWTVLVFTVASYFASLSVVSFKCFFSPASSRIGNV